MRSSISRLKRLFRPSLVTFYDQGIQSITNFLAIALLARSFSQDVVSDFVITVSVWQVLQGLQRSIVILPYIISKSHLQNDKYLGNWLLLNLLFACAVSVVLLIFLWFTSMTGQLGITANSFKLSLMLGPSLLCYEFARRWMYQSQRYIHSAIMATLLAVFYMAGIVASLYSHQMHWSVVGYSFGGLCSALIAIISFPGELSYPYTAINQWKSMLPSTFWHLCSFIAHSTYTTALPLLIVAFSSKDVVTAFAATRALVTPALTAGTALDSVEKPRASRAFALGGLADLGQVVGRTRKLLILMSLPLFVVLALAGQTLLGKVYGEDYSQYYPSLLLWIPTIAIMLINQPTETKLIVIQASRVLFISKLVSSVAAFGFLWYFVIYLHLGVNGAVASALSAVSVNLVLNLYFDSRVARPHLSKVCT